MAMVNPYNYAKPKNVTVNPVKPKPVIKVVPKTNGYGGQKSQSYLEQKIMSAKPEELTLMLYDGIIKFLKQAQLMNEQKNIEKTNYLLQRAQAIVDELRQTLNMEIEISHNLESLYIFMTDRLVDANMEKDNAIIDEVLEIAVEMRDTWKQAMKL